MAEVIFVEQTLEGFTLHPQLGDANFLQYETGAVPILENEIYTVVWDGIEYSCPSWYEDLFGIYAIGNMSIYTENVEDTGEPFVIGGNDMGGLFVTSDIVNTSHTVSIYKGVSVEDDSASIILKNYSGVDVRYDDANAVVFDTPSGGQAIYSRGEAIEGVNVELNLASGDQVVKAPDGMLVKSAIIKKPADLKPHNILKGVNIAGVEGSLTVVGAETTKTVDLDFKDYVSIDNVEQMNDVLNHRDNIGLHILYTGETGTYINGHFYKVTTYHDTFDPNDCPTSATEVASDTTLSSSIECEIGDLIIATFVIRSPLVSLSDGWTLISTSQDQKDINTTATTNQTLSFAYKYATTTNESITITQNTAARIYINMVAFNKAASFTDLGYKYQNNEIASDSTSATFDRPTEPIVIWAITRALWTTDGSTWTTSNESKLIQSDIAIQPRLLMAIDATDDDEVTFNTNISNTTDVYICGVLSIQLSEELHFTTVDYENVPIDDIQTVVPNEGEVLNKVEVHKPNTLIPENIAKGVNIGGVIGTAKTGGVSFDDVAKNFYMTLSEDGTEIEVAKIKWDRVATHTSENAYHIKLEESIDGYPVRYKL